MQGTGGGMNGRRFVDPQRARSWCRSARRCREGSAHWVFAFLWVVLLLGGCGARGDLGQVRGKVTLDSVPLPDAFVEFVPQGSGSTSYGKTDASGEYELMFSMTAYGASLGESVVRITTRDLYFDEQGRERWYPEKVPARYNTKSELVVTVEPGDNEFNFYLKSDESTTTSEQSSQ